jgi:methionyl-tRNA formyltransferase
MKQDFRIVFMGSPEFAVETLDTLVRNSFNIVAVVTVPDKPAGRGRKITQSPVKQYAIEHGFKLLQPSKLTDPEFVDELISLKADLHVVVAFRILPQVILDIPVTGSVNLHASLLPQYRGAAPINWSVINGEKLTGVTTFFLDKNIDTGNILFWDEVNIGENETAGELHDRLMVVGAALMLKTVHAIDNNDYTVKDQKSIVSDTETLKKAPKIYREDCRINWENKAVEIFNRIRGLSPFPTAFTELISPDDERYYIKIFQSSYSLDYHERNLGELVIIDQKQIKIPVSDGFISLEEVAAQWQKNV